jgi:hypothetical protein
VEVFEKDSIFDHPPREIFLLVFYCILLSFTLLVFLYPIKDLIRWFKPLPKCNYYYFTENGSKFYIIKPTANNEFIVGDAGEEYESSTFKIVSKEEIKEHTLHKEKVKIPSKNLKSIYNSLKNRFKRKTVKDT